jgi:hypothetical protein
MRLRVSKDGGGVDLQELSGVDDPIVLFLTSEARTYVARPPFEGWRWCRSTGTQRG